MKIKISVPNDLSDITLEQYKRYEKIVNTNKGDEHSERFIHLKC